MLSIEILFTRIFLIKSAADTYPGSSMRGLFVLPCIFPIFPHVTVYQIWAGTNTEMNVYIHLANRNVGITEEPGYVKPEILLISWTYSHTRKSIPYTNTIIPDGHCTEFAYEVCCYHLLAACCCCC